MIDEIDNQTIADAIERLASMTSHIPPHEMFVLWCVIGHALQGVVNGALREQGDDEIEVGSMFDIGASALTHIQEQVWKMMPDSLDDQPTSVVH